MINLRFYLFIGVVALFSGCTNPNKMSVGEIQEPKNIQYKDSNFKNTIVQNNIVANSDKEAKSKLKFITQYCVKKYGSFYDYVYLDERYSVNYWFEVTDNTIKIERNLRNILKKKDELKNEELLLGGTQGNQIYKIDLPYKLDKINETTYKIVIQNNETINVTESFNKESNKAYEPTSHNISMETFKEIVNRIAVCI